MEGPLDRLVPATVDLVEHRIKAALVLPAEQASSLVYATAGEQYPDEITTAMESLLKGKPISAALTDLTGLDESQILEIFDRSIDSILENPAVEPRYKDSIRAAEPELRQAFVSGDTREFLTQATRTAAERAFDFALADFRSQLDEQGRLDLVLLLAEDALGIPEEELQDKAKQWRERTWNYLNWTRNVSLAAFILAVAVMALVFWQNLGAFLKWLYWTLIIAGAVALFLLALAYFVIPTLVENLTDGSLARGQTGFSELGALAAEVTSSAFRNQVRSLLVIAAVPMVAGMVLWILGPALVRLLRNTESPTGEGYPQDDS